MKFNSLWSAKSKIQEITSCLVDYTNDGFEVIFTASTIHLVDETLELIKKQGFETAKIVGKKWKRILVNYKSIETVRTTVISVEF